MDLKTKKWLYQEIRVPGHPETRPNGLVYEHRIAAETLLKRRLKFKEVVHHIDNNPSNNNYSNIMVFATQGDHTRFHRGWIAILKSDGAYYCVRPLHPCEICKTACRLSNRYCSQACSQLAVRKVQRPSKALLAKLLKAKSLVAIGKQFGVSDNAIRKWIKFYGIERG